MREGPDVSEEPSHDVEERIALLTQARTLLSEWHSGHRDDKDRSDLRTKINRLMQPCKQAVLETGVGTEVVFKAPWAAGGGRELVDLFGDPFVDLMGLSVIPKLIDQIDQAIGVYESVLANPGLIRLRPTSGLDIEAAIERALRPSFGDAPPKNEREVQDELEVILQSIGVDYTRDQEVAPVGPKAFRPDFSISDQSLALEVKLATPTHDEKEIQEELSADIAAYSTKWKHLLAVIYDLGVISNPYRLRQENMKHFGVTVVVVKH